MGPTLPRRPGELAPPVVNGVPPMLAAPPEPEVPTLAPQETETDSVVTQTTTPRTSGKVQSKETRAATKELESAASEARKAQAKAMEEEAKLETRAIELDQARITKQREAEDALTNQRMEAESKRAAQQSAADLELEKADAAVKKAQNEALNWDSRNAPMKILDALIRGRAARNSYMLNEDPNNSPVARALDGALAEEKEKKQKAFLASKEWRETLKTRNADLIKRTYEQEQAKIEIQANALARSLLLSEKTDALVTKAAKNDPNGTHFQSQRDAALTKLDKQDAEAKQRFAQNYDPNVTSGGTTTTTTKKSVTKSGEGTDVVDQRTVYNADGSVRGLAPGTAKVSHDGVKTREMYAQLQPIKEGLGVLRNLVGDTDNWDRVPGAGLVSSNQQRIKGQLENMVAPISQFLGSGTPQEKEAQRRLKTLTVSLGQGKEVSQANIDSLIKYIEDAYDAKIKSVVPDNKAVSKGAAPAAASGGPKDGDTKTVEGYTFTYRNGQWQ